MNLAITGASGFVGKGLVEYALHEHHQVLALSRRSASSSLDSLQPLSMDLVKDDIPAETFAHCDVLIHLALAKSDTRETSAQASIDMSIRLFESAYRDGVRHFVLVSSIAVLDYQAAAYSEIRSSSALNDDTLALGDYAFCKREQERAIVSWAQKNACSLEIVRPGLIYSADNYSDAHAGFIKKGMGIIVKHQGQVPLVSLDNTAKKIFALLSHKSALHIRYTHILDDTLPTQAEYIQTLKQRGAIKLALPLPWQIYTTLTLFKARSLQRLGLNRYLPDALKPASILARAKPFIFAS